MYNTAMYEIQDTNSRASITKATEATITNLNPTAMGYSNSNEIYTIKEYKIRNEVEIMGFLHVYDHHLYEIMTYSVKYVKNYCGWLQPDYIGERSAKYHANRKLFHEFLKRYMAGEFKYRKSFHHAAKAKYYHELNPQVQRKIKRVVDTLNDIYAA